MTAATTTITPCSAQEVQACVCEALREGRTVEVCGGGGAADIGAPRRPDVVLTTRRLTGVVAYDPREMYVTVEAGARLTDLQSLLAAQGQSLAFDPADPQAPSCVHATIGGVVAAGLAGPRRLSGGGVRDHLLGFAGVTGRGELLRGGATVVKNVTGFDLPKIIAGSWGRLCVITQVTLRVVPAPQASITLRLGDLADDVAVRAMSRALGAPIALSAAAHLPQLAGRSATLLRLDGFAATLPARGEALRQLLADMAPAEILGVDEADALWRRVRLAAPLAKQAHLWRLHVSAAAAPRVAERLAPLGAQVVYDWGGHLLWVGLPDDARAAEVREAARDARGHAMLVRAPPGVRARVPAFHPSSSAATRLRGRIRRMFDPGGVFETGRFAEPDHEG